MPRDMPFSEPAQRTPIRSAVLDLIAQAGGPRPDEPEFILELRDIVASRSRADELWDKYRGARAHRRFG
jgi:hypothetical protein